MQVQARCGNCCKTRNESLPRWHSIHFKLLSSRQVEKLFASSTTLDFFDYNSIVGSAFVTRAAIACIA